MMKRILATAVALFLGLAGSAEAATFFLDNGAGKGGSDSNACTDAAAPCATLTHVLTLMTAGDTLYIGSHHAESVAVTTIWSFQSTTVMSYAIAVDDTPWTTGYTPVTADLVDPTSANFPVFQATSGNLEFQDSFYMRGVQFLASGTGGQTIEFVSGSSSTEQCENCEFDIAGTSASSTIQIGSAASRDLLLNCRVNFSATQQVINTVGEVDIRGQLGSFFIKSGSTVPTNLFGGSTALVYMDGVFLGATPTNLIVSSALAARMYVVNSNVAPTNLASLSPVGGYWFISSQNSDSTTHSYDYASQNLYGSVNSDTTVFRSGGMTYDGTNGISYRLTGTSSTSVAQPARGTAISLGHLSSGTSTTITLYFVFDGANNSQGFNSATLNNNQIWMRIAYQGSGSSSVASFASNKIANYLPSTTPATQGTSAGSWTTTGLTTPETYSMDLTFTPLLAGNYVVYVEGNMGSGKKIWYDPQFTCSGNCS